MPENELDIFDEQAKNDIAYRACVGGMAMVGIGIGSFAGGQALAGGAAGLIWGLLTCKKISPAIKKKLFSSSQRLHDHEIASLLREIHNQRPYMNKKDSIKVLAYVRTEIPRNRGKYNRPGIVV